MSDDLIGQSAQSETFFDALEYNDMPTVTRLVAVCKDAQNVYGNRPLHVCIENDNLEFFSFLLESKADTSLFNSEGKSALHIAAEEGRLEFASALVAAGADVNLKSAEGNTPLHAASYRAQVAVVELLVNSTADVNAQNSDKDTPLHFASWRGSAEIVSLLAEKKANVSVAGKDGKSPLDTATEEGQDEIATLLSSLGATTAPEAAVEAEAEEDEGQEPPTANLTPEEEKRLEDEKRKLRMDNEKYLRAHPELNTLLQSFLMEMLEKRPDNIAQAAVDYFTAQTNAA
jgi:ankyrin repeat protein